MKKEKKNKSKEMNSFRPKPIEGHKSSIKRWKDRCTERYKGRNRRALRAEPFPQRDEPLGECSRVPQVEPLNNKEST